MTAQEIDILRPPPAQLAHGSATARLFRVRSRSQWVESVYAATGLPRLRDPHPYLPDVRCHALIPRRQQGGSGWEVLVLYRVGVPDAVRLGVAA